MPSSKCEVQNAAQESTESGSGPGDVTARVLSALPASESSWPQEGQWASAALGQARGREALFTRACSCSPCPSSLLAPISALYQYMQTQLTDTSLGFAVPAPNWTHMYRQPGTC